MPHKEGHLLVDRYKKKKADIEYPFEHGEVINVYVSIHPVTKDTEVLSNSVAGEDGNHSGISP